MNRPKLTSQQGKTLHECVRGHEQTGRALNVGQPGDTTHDHARALIRAGLAQWHPPIPPISYIVSKRGFTIDRGQIVPTPAGRDHVGTP